MTVSFPQPGSAEPLPDPPGMGQGQRMAERAADDDLAAAGWAAAPDPQLRAGAAAPHHQERGIQPDVDRQRLQGLHRGCEQPRGARLPAAADLVLHRGRQRVHQAVHGAGLVGLETPPQVAGVSHRVVQDGGLRGRVVGRARGGRGRGHQRRRENHDGGAAAVQQPPDQARQPRHRRPAAARRLAGVIRGLHRRQAVAAQHVRAGGGYPSRRQPAPAIRRSPGTAVPASAIPVTVRIPPRPCPGGAGACPVDGRQCAVQMPPSTGMTAPVT